MKYAKDSPPTHSDGFEVKLAFHFLAVKLGHVTAAPTQAPVIAKWLLRAKYIATLPLTMREQSMIAEIGLAPCWCLAFRVPAPAPSVVRKLNLVPLVVLELSSCGLTCDVLGTHSVQ